MARCSRAADANIGDQSTIPGRGEMGLPYIGITPST